MVVVHVSYIYFLGLRLHIAAVHAIGEAGSRKYKCDECDKMFKCSADLKVHTVSHTKEKVSKCFLKNLNFLCFLKMFNKNRFFLAFFL